MSGVLEDIERSRRVIRKKYQKLRRLQNLRQQQVSQALEPIVTPLKELVKTEVKVEPSDGDSFRSLKQWKLEHLKPETSISAGDRDSDNDYDDDYADAANLTVLENSSEMDRGVATSSPELKPEVRAPLSEKYLSELRNERKSEVGRRRARTRDALQQSSTPHYKNETERRERR